MKVKNLIISVFENLGFYYDSGRGDCVPNGVYDSSSTKGTPTRLSSPAPIQDDWKGHTTKTGVKLFQKGYINTDVQNGHVMEFEIRETKPKGKTGRKDFITNADAEEILNRQADGKITSINWETIRRVKEVWANNEGKTDSVTVAALKNEMSERTVRTFTAAFNVALSLQEGQSGEKYAKVCKEGLSA
jgi:hypothetical protein